MLTFAVMNAKQILKTIWDNPKNKRIIKDTALFAVATIAFHFLYWNTNMDTWLFGPFTTQVFDFFTGLAYKGCALLMGIWCDVPYDAWGNHFGFYTLDALGAKTYFADLEVIHDCSAIKQLMQFLLIIILCSGKWWQKSIYYICGCIILLFANILRIYLLTILFAHNPAEFPFYHDWIARPLMYVIIFALWYLWTSRFAYREAKTETAPSKH